MKVILKENINNLGKAGDVVKVSDGYARNFLIPTGKAIIADERNLKILQEQIKNKFNKKIKEEEEIKKEIEKLKGVEIIIKRKVSKEGKLFGSVNENDIVNKLKEEFNIELNKNNIKMEKHIKELGIFDITIVFKAELETKIKLKVEPEN